MEYCNKESGRLPQTRIIELKDRVARPRRSVPPGEVWSKDRKIEN